MKSLSLSKLTILLFTGLFFTLVSCEQPKPNLPEKTKTDVETDPMNDTVSVRGFTYAEFASSIKLTIANTNSVTFTDFDIRCADYLIFYG